MLRASSGEEPAAQRHEGAQRERHEDQRDEDGAARVGLQRLVRGGRQRLWRPPRVSGDRDRGPELSERAGPGESGPAITSAGNRRGTTQTLISGERDRGPELSERARPRHDERRRY